MKKRKKALVIGGSGATGRELVSQLLQDERVEQVTVLVRRLFFDSHPKLYERVVDFEDLSTYREDIRGDVAFSCLGTTIKDAGSQDAQWRVDHDYSLEFARLAKENGVPSFVLLSAIGAHPDSRIFYSKMKGALEQQIALLGFSQLLIMQPAGIDRPNSDRLGEKIGIGISKVIQAFGILKAYAPISTDRLASAMICAYFEEEKPLRIYSVAELLALSSHTKIQK